MKGINKEEEGVIQKNQFYTQSGVEKSAYCTYRLRNNQLVWTWDSVGNEGVSVPHTHAKHLNFSWHWGYGGGNS